MIVAIVGSRTFHDYALFQLKLDEFRREHVIDGIVSGGAQGADKLAERYAAEQGIPIELLLPDWSGRLGRGAGLARNTDIVAKADMVITFWDGKSHGTRDTINKAQRARKPIFVGWK